MKGISLFFLFLLIRFSFMNAQYYYNDALNKEDSYRKFAITSGLLQGGGSLIGADLEMLIDKNVGIQAGAGVLGFGAGLNIHFKPSIRSSFISIQYWHQGVGEYYTQSVLGPTFVFRGKKWFTAQLGIGFAVDKGMAWPESVKQPPAMLLYSIGAYFPF